MEFSDRWRRSPAGPFVVGFEEHGAGEAEQGLGVVEDADDVRPACTTRPSRIGTSCSANSAVRGP
jgi:hypothetical protein